VDFFASAGPFTELATDERDAVRGFGLDPAGLCLLAQGLLISPPDAFGVGLSEQRLAERNTRPARALLARVLELNDTTPLDQPRPPEQRVVGTCRHFAVMATAFLRAVDVPARARCGFAAYFVPPRMVDHWIVEHWSHQEQRWIRADAEYLERPTPGSARTGDLRPEEFLTAGEAWQRIRSGTAGPMDFGVFGTENWGPGEVRGNAMRDLASLACKVEMLPWDEWGPMQDSYDGRTGADFDQLIDRLAVATADPAHVGLHDVYDQLAVPASMIG